MVSPHDMADMSPACYPPSAAPNCMKAVRLKFWGPPTWQKPHLLPIVCQDRRMSREIPAVNIYLFLHESLIRDDFGSARWLK